MTVKPWFSTESGLKVAAGDTAEAECHCEEPEKHKKCAMKSNLKKNYCYE